MVKKNADWIQQFERAAVDYFYDEKGRDFSLSAIQNLANRKKIKIPKDVKLKSIQTILLKRVKSFAQTSGIRIDGIKLDEAKKFKPTSKDAKQLQMLCQEKRWNETRAAKEFGVEVGVFKHWMTGGKLGECDKRLLEIMKSPAKTKVVTTKKALKKEPEWQLRTTESRRLFKLKTKKEWSVETMAKAFGVGTRLIKWWLDGSMKPRGSARKILEFYEKN